MQVCVRRSARLACLGVCLRWGVGSRVGWGLQSPDFLTLPLSDTCERSVGSLCLSTLLCNHKVQMTPPAACSLPARAGPGCNSTPHPHPTPASSVRGEEKSIKISTWSKRRPKPRHHMHSFRAIDDWRALLGSLIHAIDLLPTVATKTVFLQRNRAASLAELFRADVHPQGHPELSARFSSLTISNPHCTWFWFGVNCMNAEHYCLKSLILNCKWSCGPTEWFWWEFLSCHSHANMEMWPDCYVFGLPST